MKIEEAKNKWCPFARVGTGMSDEHGWSYNRLDTQNLLPESAMCITNKCMLWKWYGTCKDNGFCGGVKI